MSEIFKTPEERETARLLGFKAPMAPVKKGPRPTTTKVLGYFNPNNWPINIMISELGGMSVVLQQKGHYVLAADGKKINDPILEQHVGVHGLAREMSAKEVPIHYIPRPVTSKPSASPVSEAAGFVKGPNGQIMPVLKSAVEYVTAEALPMNGVPVVGMTVEMARRLKLIKPTRAVTESSVVDTDGAPASGERLPQMDYAEDMTPGEVRRMGAKPVRPIAVAAPLNPELTTPETPEQAATIASLQEAAKEDPLGVTDVARIAPNLPDEGPAPVEEPSTEPAAVYGGEPALEASAATASAPPPRFVCDADGVGFQFRSALERHVKLKYPTRVDELMAPYPKPPKIQPTSSSA